MKKSNPYKLVDHQQQVKKGRHAEYVPPNEAVIEQLARQVCTTLQQKGYETFSSPEVMEGLTEFPKVIARLTAKSLTQGQGKWLNDTQVRKKAG